MPYTLRATRQAGHIWSQSLVPVLVILSPADWGWIKYGSLWSPVNPYPGSFHSSVQCNCTKQENGMKICYVCKCVRGVNFSQIQILTSEMNSLTQKLVYILYYTKVLNEIYPNQNFILLRTPFWI